MVGWVRLRGPLQVRPCKLGRRLLVCAVLRTRQDRGWASCPTRPRHASGPCGSRPRHRTHPAFDSSPRSVGMHGLLLVGVDPGRHVDPRHAWMLFVQLSKYSISMEIHPRMAWIYLRHRKSVGDGGWCGLAGPLAPWMAPSSPHGWVYGVSCQPTPPQPTSKTPRAGCCRCSGFGRCRAAGPADPPYSSTGKSSIGFSTS